MTFGFVTRLKPSDHALNLGYIDPRRWGVTPTRTPPNMCVRRHVYIHMCTHLWPTPHPGLATRSLEMAHTAHVFRKRDSEEQDFLGMVFPAPVPPFGVMG